MKIIEVSNDQNTVKTDDGKEHEFVCLENVSCSKNKCSLLKNLPYPCYNFCCSNSRKDKKNGYFQLK